MSEQSHGRRTVTRGEFDNLECNRCGACCERILLPSPLKFVEALARQSLVDRAPAEWQLENQRFVAWLSDLEPTGPVFGTDAGTVHEYRCVRFVRLPDGTGFCTAHDKRPNLCREFPYGRPVSRDEYPD